MSREQFKKYRRRFSPYCSVASLYLWAVASGAIPEMKDYAPKSKQQKITKSARGLLSKYANPKLLKEEESAWERAVEKKYGNY